jgi:NAD-dependent deacetylase
MGDNSATMTAAIVLAVASEALSAPTMRDDPDRTWRAIGKIASAAGNAQPNAGHFALVEIEKRLERFVLLTQNVDGLHRRAGSRNVIDIHGDTFNLLCTSCAWRGGLDPKGLAPFSPGDPAQIVKASPAKKVPDPFTSPRCPKCRAVVRPDVVLFGEMLPVDKLARLQAEFFQNPPEVVISVGTSAMFPYIVQPMLVAAQAGRLTIEINPDETDISELVDFHLREPAGVALPAIAAALSR